MVQIPGGTFRMGSDRFYPEERPVREVYVEDFWIDRHPVTNQQYSRFVKATGYVTVAERAPDPALYPGAPAENLVAGSMVFSMTADPVDLANNAQWWAWTPGASWRRPRDPGSRTGSIANHPVVHVALEDVEAYCAWTGTDLPTEAEWEYAARGGRDGAIFTWGDEERPDGQLMANTWQGHFPWQNTKADGYLFTSPVGSFPANGYNVLDMAGNVWEWTKDWYAVHRLDAPEQTCCMAASPRADAREASINPQHAHFRIPRKVVKGGSTSAHQAIASATDRLRASRKTLRHRHEPHRVSVCGPAGTSKIRPTGATAFAQERERNEWLARRQETGRRAIRHQLPHRHGQVRLMLYMAAT
jgi:formylglycine-generating enzyme required for sulfatase activity